MTDRAALVNDLTIGIAKADDFGAELLTAAIDLIRAETLEEAEKAVAYLRWQEVEPFDGRTLGHAVNAIRAMKGDTNDV
jgi:hypothetical protein